MKNNCITCKYNDIPKYESPCRNCVIFNKFETKQKTNDQWLCELSASEKAKLFCKDFCSNYCPRQHAGNVDCDNNCEQAMLDWLQAEHKE